MIDPEQYYTPGDAPTPEVRLAMWDVIHGRILRKKPSRLFSLERRSFAYGMAASFIIMFTAVGLYTSVKNAVEYSQPQIVKLDRAYQTAIKEFEKIALQRETPPSNPARDGALTSRKEQLQELESAIESLRAETRSGDISPMKRSRLRDLYSLKLKLLQEMVEQGEIEL